MPARTYLFDACEGQLLGLVLGYVCAGVADLLLLRPPEGLQCGPVGLIKLALASLVPIGVFVLRMCDSSSRRDTDSSSSVKGIGEGRLAAMRAHGSLHMCGHRSNPRIGTW